MQELHSFVQVKMGSEHKIMYEELISSLRETVKLIDYPLKIQGAHTYNI